MPRRPISIRFAAGKVGARLQQLRRSEARRRDAQQRCAVTTLGDARAVRTVNPFLPGEKEQVGNPNQHNAANRARQPQPKGYKTEKRLNNKRLENTMAGTAKTNFSAFYKRLKKTENKRLKNTMAGTAKTNFSAFYKMLKKTEKD